MTHNCFVILLGCVVVLVTGSVVVAGECPQGDSNENCTLTTDNNEIEALSTQRTQEITTLTSENVDTTPLNMLIEDTTENEFRPTPISSSTTSSTTENSSTTTVSASDSQEETTNITTDENRNVASNSTPSSEMNETTPSITTDNQNMSSSTPFSEMNETTTNADDIQTVSNSTPSSEIKDITTSTDNSQIMSNSTPPIEVKETTTSTDNSQNIISNSTPSSEAKDITTSTENNNVVSISTPSEIKDTTLGITTESNQNIASNTTPSSTTEMLIATTSNVSEEPETTTLNLNIADEQNTISNSTPLKISTEKIITTSEKSQKSTTENLITTTAEASDEEERTTLHDEEEKSKSDSTTPLNSNMEMEHPTQNILINSVIPLKTTTEKLITSTQVSDEPEAMTMHISVNEASMNSPTTETPTEAPMVTTTNVAMEPEGRSFGFDLDEEQNALTNSSVPMHTTEHLITTVADVSDEPKGRALNFTIDDAQNILSNLTNHHHHDYDFTDMIDNNDDDNENFDIGSLNAKILAPKLESHNSTIGICEKGGLTYENGERLENDCDTVCICKNGVMDCAERCSSPYFRKGKKIEDPLCTAKDVEDSCCALLECASDTETEPLEFCSHENNTYNRGDSFNKECSEVCTCEAAGKISCKPRCPPTTKTSDECVELPDPKDPCCKQVFCDVTLDEHDSENEKPEVISKKQKVLSASFINATTIQLTFETKFEDNESLPIIEVSDDKMDWKFYKLFPGDLVFVRENSKYLKLENSDDIVEIQNTEIGPSHEDTVSEDSADCYYKGKTFKEGEEYNDNCTALCVCKNTEMMCLKLQCPTYFGLDVMDSNCIEWETIPPNFQPSPPNCCPSNVRCKNNGSCDFEGIIYKNWEQLPENITGCEKRCYCEMGKVECQNTCPPVPALPPPNLPCPPNLAEISHIPEDECCKGWVCHPQNIPQETGHNRTESDIREHSPTHSTDKYLGPFATKAPSKVLGPLAVYENEERDENVSNNSLDAVHKPKVNPNENPFYHKIPPTHVPDVMKIDFKNEIPEYLGPFHPSDGGLNMKKNKDSKTKIHKNVPVFVTPPPPTMSTEQSMIQNEKVIPDKVKPPPSFTPDEKPSQSEIDVHSHNNPEEILQFIHQHPEISNYPSGSVVEIHNLPSHSKPKPIQHVIGPGLLNNPHIHLVPYIIPQNSKGEQIKDDLPPGISLDEILQEFQKNIQPLQNPLPYLSHPDFMNNDGLSLMAHHTRPIPNRPNASYPGPSSPLFPNFQQPQDEISVHTLEPIDSHTVRLAFMVPPIIVGLHGRVEVRYTDKDDDDDDQESWMLQVFAPPNDLIATPSLEFDLLDLKPDTEYKIKITITLRDLHNTPMSRIYKIKTPREVQLTTLPPMIPIEPDLAITDINATWVTVVWRMFTQYELQFIDGVQLRYKEIDGRIYTATPLIHRSVTSYTLENLKPNTKYEVGIFFIPFPDQHTELHTENMLHFTTANEIDTYGFNVSLEISQIKSQSVEISWNGVPYPEDKYVNIYRAIYQSDTGKEDQSTFKIAKRDSPTKTVIMDLKPGTSYRLWLEVYLTNGKIKTSNVQQFITKPRVAPALGASTQQDKLARAEVIEKKGDYYGPLVIVAILAAIAILSTLILLLILVRRHNQNKAAITPPSTRISQSAYDNPTYKVEIQQETMGL